jgi:hypothetical protein
MTTTDQVRAILGGTMRAYQSDPAYRQRPEVLSRLDWIGRRLNQPIRIALAGTLKAGKSTLVNALVGENIAPTDATEATRIVTWFRHGPTPQATANHIGGRRSDVPIGRDDGLTFDFSLLDPNDVVDLDVQWPATQLVDTVIVDTPGTSSLSTDVSERTLQLLVPVDGVPRVDAVVFLLRTLNDADIRLLKQIGELVGGSAGALGVIGVASRADEIGAGRIDAMPSAKDVAARFTAEMDKTGICQAVVPVAGLLALTARTLRQSEFIALQKLSGVDQAELTKAMLSADRFSRDESALPLDAATRSHLLDRFGMFGLRISTTLLRSGIADSGELADELLDRSGLVALRDVIDQQFAQRADLLKAHTALMSLRRFVQLNPSHAAPHILADVEPLLADTHAFEELRLIRQLRSCATSLREDEVASLLRVIGGSGCDPASRLGLTAETASDGPRAALAAAQRWRRRAEHPLNDLFTTRACHAAARSAEAMVTEFAAGRNELGYELAPPVRHACEFGRDQ